MKKIATIDQTLNKSYSRVEVRKASRAIIIHNGLLLMICSGKNGDYKFPGGGRKVFENAIDNLVRETREETGYEIIKDSIHPLGYVEEVNEATNKKRGLFKMISEFYFCDVKLNHKAPMLDEYEKKLNYEAVFVSPQYALMKNEELDVKRFPWILRENLILKIIIRMLGDNYEGINLL